jgi:hypothetical protein
MSLLSSGNEKKSSLLFISFDKVSTKQSNFPKALEKLNSKEPTAGGSMDTLGDIFLGRIFLDVVICVTLHPRVDNPLDVLKKR